MEEIITDPFLRDYRAIERLIKDYIKHGQLVIAYDYDNTVYDYHDKGYEFKMVINLLRECKPYCKFIVYTHSNDDRHGEIIEYLDSNDIPWDTINEGIVFANGKCEGKLFYSHFLDDRAGLRSAYIILDKAMRIISQEPKTMDEARELYQEQFGKSIEL
jgi:hypothetical protein